MSKTEIQIAIAEMEEKLNETVSGMGSGPVKDAMKLVVPMMKDQLNLMREIVKELP